MGEAEQTAANVAPSDLPEYAPMLAAYHRAAADDLKRIIGDLPLQPGMRVLDMACGDGVYSVWIAQRIGEQGQVVGVDVDPAYLAVAQKHAASSDARERIRFETGSIDRLPFADNTFDLVWCAHSLYSLPDPIAALRELRRVVQPGGRVIILENDTLHHMLLPWPVELEFAVRSAQYAALTAQQQNGTKFYIGRHLCSSFETAGLEQCHIATYAIARRAPLTADERTWLQHYLADVQARAWPYLEPAARDALSMLLDPRSHMYLLDRSDFFMSHLEIVGTAIKRPWRRV